ncbi:MAG: YdeI/OmpD-associated family protein [Saprospiraceae bacterium]
MENELIEFESRIFQLEYLLNVNYVEIPADIIAKLGGNMKQRVLCTINGQLTFQSGFMALGEGKAYVTVNKLRMKQLKLRTGDPVAIRLQKDESEYGMAMPEELSELLKIDDLGSERFEQLSPGKQRWMIYYISQVKSSQLRIDRAILILDYLKSVAPGRLDFREMMGMDPR